MTSNSIIIVDTTSAIKNMIDDIQNLPANPPSLYLDLEGVDLSRHGTVSILQLHVYPKSKIYIIDVHKLGTMAFYAPGTNNTTFRSVLESATVPKVFFDCRNDSDALHYHFAITLKGVIDVQLLEVATREKGKHKENLKGLGTCIERHCTLTPMQQLACQWTKNHGKSLFAPDRGGSYEVFNKRPLRQAILDYCAQDVTFLPELWVNYTSKITEEWARAVEVETEERIKDSHEKVAVPGGRWRSLSPWR